MPRRVLGGDVKGGTGVFGRGRNGVQANSISAGVYGDNNDVGAMQFRMPRFHESGPAGFFLAGRLEKMLDPSGTATA